MNRQRPSEPNRSNYKVYQLTLKGAFEADWTDWFNGMLIASERNSVSETKTTITCKVRDQAELVGIINWLHNMNLVIEKVCLSSNELEEEDA